jgi:hypothetical protein
MAGDNVLLPGWITRLEGVSLATPIGIHRYTGPALLQARADRFMSRNLDFDFDWGAPIRIQRVLWRCGVGLGDADAVLGPHNWAVLGERMLLGDTGSLTRDRRTALAVMDERRLDEVEARVTRTAATCGMEAVARDYLRVIREGLETPSLTDLWNTGTSGDRTPSEGPAPVAGGRTPLKRA